VETASVPWFGLDRSVYTTADGGSLALDFPILQSTADYPLNLTWSGFTVTPLTITGAGSVKRTLNYLNMNTPPVVATVRASNGQSSYTAKSRCNPAPLASVCLWRTI